MKSDEAVLEFVNMLRLGAGALRQILADDNTLGLEFEPDIALIFGLADSLEDVAENLRGKTRLRQGLSSL